MPFPINTQAGWYQKTTVSTLFEATHSLELERKELISWVGLRCIFFKTSTALPSLGCTVCNRWSYALAFLCTSFISGQREGLSEEATWWSLHHNQNMQYMYCAYIHNKAMFILIWHPHSFKKKFISLIFLSLYNLISFSHFKAPCFYLSGDHWIALISCYILQYHCCV